MKEPRRPVPSLTVSQEKKEKMEKTSFFFLGKALDGDNLLHIFCEEKDKNLSYLSLRAFVFHTKLIAL